jgi:hypothetical protein
MNALPRRLAALGAPAVLLVSLTACGGGPGGDAPEDASVEDFCTAYAKVATLEDGQAIKDWSEEMAEIGTPEGIGDEEREGFVILVDAANDVDEDADVSDLEGKDLSDDEEAAVTAFATYGTTTCRDQITDSLGSELELPDPGVDPSDLPELPDLSDLPEAPTPS